MNEAALAFAVKLLTLATPLALVTAIALHLPFASPR